VRACTQAEQSGATLAYEQQLCSHVRPLSKHDIYQHPAGGSLSFTMHASSEPDGGAARPPSAAARPPSAAAPSAAVAGVGPMDAVLPEDAVLPTDAVLPAGRRMLQAPPPASPAAAGYLPGSVLPASRPLPPQPGAQMQPLALGCLGAVQRPSAHVGCGHSGTKDTVMAVMCAAGRRRLRCEPPHWWAACARLRLTLSGSCRPHGHARACRSKPACSAHPPARSQGATIAQ